MSNAEDKQSEAELIALIEQMCRNEEQAFNFTCGAFYSDCKEETLPPIDRFAFRILEAIKKQRCE